MESSEWEVINSEQHSTTWRFEVPNGWIIRHATELNGFQLCYVPDANKVWKRLLKISEKGGEDGSKKSEVEGTT